MITFPGYSDIAKLIEWYENFFDPISYFNTIIWAVFNLLSTIVTIVGIKKMINTLRELKKFNHNLQTNYFQLTLHALVLTLNLVPVIF
jgi:hypothetical protein